MRTLPNPQTLRMRFFALILSFMLLVPTFATATAESEALIHIERQQWSRLNQVIPRLRDPLIRDIALWYDLANNQQMDDFSQYSAFLQRHPDWPLQEKLLLRAELTLLNGYNSEQTILAWLAAHPPKTARGIFYVEERKSKNKPTASAIKNAWIQADFTELDEKRFLVNYRAQLSTADHIARTDRLLWEGQLNAASRMLLRIPKDEETMFQARIALMKRKGNFDALLARVPARLKNSPGLLYERMRFRFDKEIYDGVTQLLLLAPASPPYPAKWWPYRRYMVREELDRHNYKLAFQLAEKHGQKDKIELSEALWLKAWIELVYLNRPKPAQQDFARMYDVVEFPVSKSRAAYWVARSARANGDGKGFRYWMQIAAQHPTTFYGQIAFEELYGNRSLVLPKPAATINEQEWQQLYKNSSLSQAVIALKRANHETLALPFLIQLTQMAKTPKMAAFAAHTGWKTGRSDFAVRAAKEALNQGYYLPDYLFPLDMTPPNLALEPALAYAIARQESMFYPKARSAADARGMMQVLPATGRLVALKHKIGFTAERLYEQDYNFVIGSHYLNDLLRKFSGSKIFAIAGYNAGPGRPVKWSAKYGALEKNQDKNIDWIERIPFAETRNYVQRVLENYQVYRALISQGKDPLTAKASILP